MNHWRTYTGIVLIATAVVLIAYDIAAEIKGGNASTISQVIYHAAQSEPTIAFALGYLMGHLFAPQAKTLLSH